MIRLPAGRRHETMRKDYLDWVAVDELIQRLLALLPRTYDYVMAVTRGGMIPAALISYRGRLRNVLVAVEQPASDVHEIFGRPTFCEFPADPLLKGKRILVVDSVWGTAAALMAVKTRIEQAGGAADLCVLHYRPQGAWNEPKPDYCAEESDAWVVFPWEPDQETGVHSNPRLP